MSEKPDIVDDLNDMNDLPEDLQKQTNELLESGELIALTIGMKGDREGKRPTTIIYKPGHESTLSEIADWLAEFDNPFRYLIYQP